MICFLVDVVYQNYQYLVKIFDLFSEKPLFTKQIDLKTIFINKTMLLIRMCLW